MRSQMIISQPAGGNLTDVDLNLYVDIVVSCSIIPPYSSGIFLLQSVHDINKLIISFFNRYSCPSICPRVSLLTSILGKAFEYYR